MLVIDEDGTIHLTRGDTAKFSIFIQNGSSSGEYMIKETDTITFTVKRAITNSDFFVQKIIHGSNMLTLNPEDTKNMQYGKYLYDVQLENEEHEIYTVIPPTTFDITGEITW